MSNRLWLSGVALVSLCLLPALVIGGWLADTVSVPPIEAFMQIGSADSPQISQNGGRLFFLSSMSGVDQVYRLLPSGWPYQLTVFEDGIDFYRISYSGRGMVVGASIGGSEQSDLYLLDTESGTIRILKAADQVRHGSPVWSPDETCVYFSSNEANGRDFHIYKVDLQDGATKSIWAEEGWNEVSDISADGRKLLVAKYVSNVNNDLYLLDLESGIATLLTEHRGDYAFEYAHLSPDAGTIYMVTNMNDDGINRVARMDVAAKTLEFLKPTTPWETEEMALSRNGGLLAWVENVEGYGVLYATDLETDAQVELCLTMGLVTKVQVSDRGTMLFSFSSPSKPPDIWEYDFISGGLEQLTHSTYAGVDPGLFVDPELVRYRSFDGLEIPAFLYLPPDWDGEAIPFVIHAHGGPENQFRPGFVRHFQYLVLHGYGILAPNIRGSSGYGRKYIKMDDYKKRKDSIRDIDQAAEWLVDSGYSQYGKIAIKGASYGGYVTLAALVEYPHVFGAGIDDVGIANFVTFLENTAEYRRAIREAEYGPLSDKEFLREISPITHADRISAPLLIVHGENDPRVPVGEARQIARAVESQGGVVETLIFPDEGHGIAKLDNRLVYYRKMVDFLDLHLKD